MVERPSVERPTTEEDTSATMPRGGGVKTAPKYIWLTDAGRQAIQEWADRQGVSFSAAIETLARLGLQQAPRKRSRRRWSPWCGGSSRNSCTGWPA